MVTLKKLSADRPKPIIMPTNPARGHMSHELAKADDQEARNRQEKLGAYEKELKKESDEKLQQKSNDLYDKKQAPKEEVKDDVVEPPKELQEPKSKPKAKNSPFAAK